MSAKDRLSPCYARHFVILPLRYAGRAPLPG
jgi:hypothetical protein